MKILIFDIETSPNIGYTWGKYEQNVVEFTQDWHIMSVAWKWLGENKTHVVALPDFPTLYKKDKTNDVNVVAQLHALFDKADIIIAHNGDQFDIKKANARFVAHGFPPPSDYKQLDTKKIAKQYFKFDSNKLDDLGKYLGLGRKIDTGGFELWKGCMSGDKSAWRKMCAYNKQDVILLEKIYLKMRPWIRRHPNVAVLENRGKCPSCTGERLQKRGFTLLGTKTRVQRYQCQDCASWTNEKLITKS